MTIGEQLRHHRGRAGMTQQQLGKKVGLTNIFISYLENDKQTPSIKTLMKIANALRCRFAIGEQGPVTL